MRAPRDGVECYLVPNPMNCKDVLLPGVPKGDLQELAEVHVGVVRGMLASLQGRTTFPPVAERVLGDVSGAQRFRSIHGVDDPICMMLDVKYVTSGLNSMSSIRDSSSKSLLVACKVGQFGTSRSMPSHCWRRSWSS
jgi:hypothetical protein